LIARSQNEAGRPLLAESGVAIDPAVLKNIAVDQHPLGVFQLEKVLDRPVDAGVARVARVPRQRLAQPVPPDLDVGRDKVRDRRVGPAEEDVLSRTLDVIVDDLERAGAIPTDDPLRIPISNVNSPR